MPLPEALLTKIYLELELDESIRLIGSKVRLNKVRMVLLFLIALTFVIAISCLNFILMSGCLCILALHIVVVSRTVREPKTIYALTSTRVLKASPTEISTYAVASEIKEIKRHCIFFNNGIEPLNLLVLPDGRSPTALVVPQKKV